MRARSFLCLLEDIDTQTTSKAMTFSLQMKDGARVNSLLYKASPKAVQLLLINPSYVELMSYNGLPYLISPMIRDANRGNR